jgi:hypothetical protein
MSSTKESMSLFEIDAELDELLEEIHEQIDSDGKASDAQMQRFQEFCKAHGEKVDRIGRFMRMMEARTQYCRGEANRLQERARNADKKLEQTKAMVLYYLKTRDLGKIEGMEFTLRRQRNSQHSVRITDDTQIPLRYRVVESCMEGELWEQILVALPEELKKTFCSSIKQSLPNHEAIKQAGEIVPGAEVKRGEHLRMV